MMHWMRKHRKWILWGIVIVIVPTFVAWGGYRSARGRDGEGEISTVVANVAGVPITREQYVDRLNAEVRRRSQYGQTATIDDLVADGSAEKILDSLIDAALINIEVAKMQPNLSREYLIERLKEDQSFQDESGKFNPTLWNDWVAADTRQNWNVIYESVANQVAREMLLKEVMAPARVLDQEVRDEFEANFTKYEMKYVLVEPQITATDEQIQEQYDADPAKYQMPEKRYVEYVAVSLKPPRPAALDEILAKARAGEDFAALAAQYSDHPAAKDNGGEAGWFAPSQSLPDHFTKVLAMAVGEVSDPMEVNDAYYIFKVDEEKVDEQTGETQKHVRQILVRPALSEEERKALDTKAGDFLLKVTEMGDFAKAAADAGLTVATAKEVTAETQTIEGMPAEDVPQFFEGIKTIPAGSLSGVIESIRHLYVSRVLEVEPAVIRPLEEVRDLVREDVVKAEKESPEYAQRVTEAAEKVKSEAQSLEQAVQMFPDLKLEIKQTEPFSKPDYLFTQGLFLQTQDVINALKGVQPGKIVGPVKGFSAQAYLFELVSATPPTEEAWKDEFPKEEEKLRKQLLASRQNNLLMDYVAALRERAESTISTDANAVSDALGLNKPNEGEEDVAAEGAEAEAAAPEAVDPDAAAPEAAAPEAAAPEAAAPEAGAPEAGAPEAGAPEAAAAPAEPAPEPTAEPAPESVAEPVESGS